MILSTSDTRLQNTIFGYLAVTAACVLLGAVYETFSHGVFSYYMIYAFAFPLAGGVIPFFLLQFFHREVPEGKSLRRYHEGIAALTTGSFFTGALEIYGTTNGLTVVYWIVGSALVFCGAAGYVLEQKRKGKRESKQA